jgi:hypothetical protein
MTQRCTNTVHRGYTVPVHSNASAVAHARKTVIGTPVTSRSHIGNTVDNPGFSQGTIGAFWMYSIGEED